MSEQQASDGFVVQAAISGAHPKIPNYPLLPGDLIVPTGLAWHKECPGLSVGGFVLTQEQIDALRPVKFLRRGLDYAVLDGVDDEAVAHGLAEGGASDAAQEAAEAHSNGMTP